MLVIPQVYQSFHQVKSLMLESKMKLRGIALLIDCFYSSDFFSIMCLINIAIYFWIDIRKRTEDVKVKESEYTKNGGIMDSSARGPSSLQVNNNV